MRNAVILAGFIAIIPVAWANDDAPETPAEQYRRLAAEYESALNSSSGRPRMEQAGQSRDAPDRRPHDPRAYATRFLKLAEDHPEGPAAFDALTWVLRHIRSGPEVEKAIKRLGEQHVKNEKLGDVCGLLIRSALSGTGELLLRRILEESPHRAVREQACLCLAFYETRLAQEARRLRSVKPEQRDRWIKALGQARVEQLLRLDPASLNQQTEHLLRRLRDEDATILRGEKIRTFLFLLSTNHAPAADSILRRILEINPHREVQEEARWALAIHQVESARLAAMIRTASPEARRQLVQDWGQDCVAPLEGTDPSIRAAEVERLLLRLADHADDRALPDISFHLMAIYTRLPNGDWAERAYHRNAERLLRRISETNPDRRVRAMACFSLAKYQVGLAQEVARLKLAPRQSVVYWIARLGRERAEQLGELDPVTLSKDAEQLLERVVHDYADVRDPVAFRPLGQQAESALLELRGPAIGQTAPEIAGDDVEGKAMKLSDYRGKVVLLNFGCHETCSPCRAMYPYEKSLVKRRAGEPFALLGFDVDADRKKLEQAMRAEGITWRSWWKNGNGPIASRWISEGLPTLYLLDPKGVIRAKYVGFPGEEVLDHAIETLLKEHSERGGD
ncbi:MAG: TlpA family protein disulfide reductase [Isosphaerales bacterium]